VHGFQEIRWNTIEEDGLNRPIVDGWDVNLQAEQEHSKYYFEIADVNACGQMYDLFRSEAKAALEKGLVLPAHDYILKCSHTFMSWTRGSDRRHERQALFADA